MASTKLFDFQGTSYAAAALLFAGFSRVTTFTINAAGTGYKVGDLITVSGGTAAGSWTARFRVAAVTGAGAVSRLDLDRAGSYTSKPGTTGLATTGGSGSGLTVDLTWLDNVAPAEARYATIQAETQNVRYRDDGTAPTASVGTILVTNSILTYAGPLSVVQFIEVAATAKLNVSVYR